MQIIGKLSLEPYKRDEITRVNTTFEMRDAVRKKINDADILIMAAAVSDFRPKERLGGKIKREKTDQINIVLERTDDILKSLSELKKNRIFVGFALSNDIDKVAPLKLKEKNLDIIVANTISAMEKDKSSGFILTKTGRKVEFENLEKEKIASLILEEVLKIAK